MARIIDVFYVARDGGPINPDDDNQPTTCHRYIRDGNIKPSWRIRNKGGDRTDGGYYLTEVAVKKWFRNNQMPIDPDEWTTEQKVQFDLTWS